MPDTCCPSFLVNDQERGYGWSMNQDAVQTARKSGKSVRKSATKNDYSRYERAVDVSNVLQKAGEILAGKFASTSLEVAQDARKQTIGSYYDSPAGNR